MRACARSGLSPDVELSLSGRGFDRFDRAPDAERLGGPGEATWVRVGSVRVEAVQAEVMPRKTSVDGVERDDEHRVLGSGRRHDGARHRS